MGLTIKTAQNTHFDLLALGDQPCQEATESRRAAEGAGQYTAPKRDDAGGGKGKGKKRR